MPRSLGICLLTVATLVSTITAQLDLTGTWSTKSNKVFTGPGFYDPVTEKMHEPDLTGISYSFTDDGHFEEAHYRAISNPQQPQCPQGIMQFQHGTFSKAANGSLTLTPFAVDGRQLLSNPCSYESAIFTRFNQTEKFQRYTVAKDLYHNVLRLDLFKFDGSPMVPMYLAYKPPQMLPTQTLNPTTASSTGGAKATGGSKAKRWLSPDSGNFLNKDALLKTSEPLNADRLWWIGVGMTGIGGVLYFCF